MIRTTESPATRKAWSPRITATAAGLALDALDVLFVDDEYAVPVLAVPCVDAGSYRLALCRHDDGPAMVLVDDAGLPDGYEELVYLAAWRLAEGQTCADVEIEVTKRTLVPREPTTLELPVLETLPVPIDPPAFDYDGEFLTELREVQVGTELVTVPPEPLPEPTRHVVSSTLVGPRARSVAERVAAILEATKAEIAKGFLFRGKRFSADPEAQTRSIAYDGVRDVLTYPVEWRAIDGSTTLLQTPAEMRQFHLTGMGAIATLVNAETAAIKAVRP